MIDNHSHSDSLANGALHGALQGALQGIVVRGYGKTFLVRHQGKDYSCDLRGSVKKAVKRVTPVAVGDDVEFSVISDETGVIEKVLPRRTKFFRPSKGIKGKMQVLAANIDQMIIVVSVREPGLHPRLIDRFLVAEQLEAYDVAVSRIGYGMPVGGHLEYVDEVTVRKSLENRRSYRS